MRGFKEFVENSIYTDQDIVNLYLNNPDRKIKEISELTGKSVGNIYRALHDNFIKPNRLITNHDNVIGFYKSGLSIKQVADLTGYTDRNVRYILNNK